MASFLHGMILLCCLSFSVTIFAAEYTVAVRAHKGIESAYQQWQATINVLNEKIPEHIFQLLPIVGLDEITKRAGNNEFDFLLTNPSSYIEVNERFNAKALVTLNNRRGNTAQSRFGSVIFTHVNNLDVLKIGDLKGRRLMVVSEPAFGGWRVGWLEMLEQGFEPYEDLGELVFTKNKTQQEVVFSVYDRKVDAGIVRTDLLERMEKAGKIDMRYFRVINNKNVKGFPFFLSTKLYPEWAFAVLNKVPLSDAGKVKKVLLSIKEGSVAAVQGKYVGWISTRDYSPVKKLMRTLKVGPYQNK